jgi:hypothetical protein
VAVPERRVPATLGQFEATFDQAMLDRMAKRIGARLTKVSLTGMRSS